MFQNVLMYSGMSGFYQWLSESYSWVWLSSSDVNYDLDKLRRFPLEVRAIIGKN